MFEFFKKGSQLNKVAQTFGHIYTAVNLLEAELEKMNNDLQHFKNTYRLDILTFAYIAHKGITERLDNNDFDIGTLLMVHPMGLKRITIMQAHTNSVSRLLILISMLNLNDEYDEIVEGRRLASQIAANVPPSMKNW
jgi:hypothetical protein